VRYQGVLRSRRLWLAALASLLGACAGNRASEPIPDDRAHAEERLQGEWLLVSFQPAMAVEPMLAALLAAQLGKLTVTFRAGAMGVVGVGVAGQRSYHVTQAMVDGFSGVVSDPEGVEYRITGAFEGLDLRFTSDTDPWRGTGRLHRVR